ncbi:hypothetical protein D3C87_1900350 [compost metagenome]
MGLQNERFAIRNALPRVRTVPGDSGHLPAGNCGSGRTPDYFAGCLHFTSRADQLFRSADDGNLNQFPV